MVKCTLHCVGVPPKDAFIFVLKVVFESVAQRILGLFEGFANSFPFLLALTFKTCINAM